VTAATADGAAASELRALRLLTALIAVTTLVATVGAGFATGIPNAATAPVGYRVAMVAAIAVPLVAGAVAPWARMRMLRLLNAGTVLTFAALLVGVLAVEWPSSDLLVQVPWFLTVTAAPVTAALVAWGRRGGWVALAVLTVLVQAIRLVSDSDAEDAIANDTFAFFTALTLVLLAGQFVAASRAFDSATRVAAAAASLRSAHEAQRVTAERLRLLVHDELLSTLSLAGRVTSTLREALGRQAARARDLIRVLALTTDAVQAIANTNGGEAVHPDGPADAALASRLLALIGDVAPDTELAHAGTDTSEGASTPAPIPTEVVDALLAAARQALVNSVAHAGLDAHRTVTLRHDETGVRLTIRDNGRGFDPDAGAGNRMGVAESILGRMRAIPGGGGKLTSQPGSGTTVELAWEAPAVPGAEPGAPTRDTTRDTTRDPITASVVVATGRSTGLFSLVSVAALLSAQAGLAVLATLRTGDVVVPALALVGVTAAFFVLGPLTAGVPSRPRATVVAGIAVATAALCWVPVDRDPDRYGDVWFIAALAFVLIVLAMRGRPTPALATAAAIAAVTLASVVVQHNDGPDVVAATTRMLAIVGVGAGFVWGIVRVRSRTTALRAAELRAVREESYRAAAERELLGRTAELEALSGELLDRLAGDAELDAELRRECVVLEGRLRDGYRAARLARHPLVDAAAAARGRGVDVALFDDPDGRSLDEAELDRIARWLAARLDETAGGRFTGRVLPAGRAAAASAASDERVAELPHVHR
jgi:signal transduction histidine kinase